jgi:predicted nucleic acid-binding protein
MFLLDSNVFIEAKNRYYAFDLAPGFWEWLDSASDAGVIGSVDEVGQELTRGDDDLAEWARRRSDVFRPTDTAVVEKLTELSLWVTSAGYTAAAVSEFLSVADYYLVAHAAAHGHTVVTHEQPQASARRRVLIPNACLAMGVSYCDTFTMLRAGSVQFGLLV